MNGTIRREVFRIPVQEVLTWRSGSRSLEEVLRDQAFACSPYVPCKWAWEAAGGDFWSDRRLEVVVEESDFVAYFVDETGGRCPHGKAPAACEACQDYAASRDATPFWMKDE